MIAFIHISQEIFAIDVLTALKSSLEQRLKHVYGDQALKRWKIRVTLHS